MINNHTYEVNRSTNYKLIIETTKSNKIDISIIEDPQYGIINIMNKENFDICYYNDDFDVITIQCNCTDSNYTIKFIPENTAIKQIHMNKDLKITFLKEMQEQFNLKEYSNDYEPCIFYGLMNNDDISVLEKNKSLKVIVWIGGDINFIINRSPNISKYIKKNVLRVLKIPKVRHISISSFITRSLTDLNLPFKHIPFMGINFSHYKPVIKGPCIYLYTSIGCEDYYGLRFYKLLMEKYKNTKFIVTCCKMSYDYLSKNPRLQKYGIKYYTKQELINDIYPQCFISLRLTDHDGLSGTVQELGLLGIKSVHNGCSPSSLNYETYDDICEHIDREMKLIGTIDQELSNKVKDYLTIDPNFFNINFHAN